MKTWMATMLVTLALCVPAFTQGRSGTEAVSADDYIGVWYAFEEGVMPDEKKGEEPSRLVILRDQKNSLIVFLAYRAADRQIRFHVGAGRFDHGVLRFTDQNGIPFRLSFGRNLQHGRFLGVNWDFPGSDSDLGGYLRMELK